MKNMFHFLLLIAFQSTAQKNDVPKNLDILVEQVKQKVITWRRDFHQNPELSNREFNTSKKVADHLKSLGIEVKEGVAKTGVIGILKGAKPIK
jgi:amidohydrolase